MSIYEAEKNSESYFADVEDEDRRLWHFTDKRECPFGGAKECKAWDKHRHICWSLLSEHQVRCYIKQHAMSSSNHNAKAPQLEGWISEGQIDQIVGELEVLEVNDTKLHREEWGQSLQKQKAGMASAAEDAAVHKGTKRKAHSDVTSESVIHLAATVADLAARFSGGQSASSGMPMLLPAPPGMPMLMKSEPGRGPDAMMAELLSEPAGQPAGLEQTILVTMQISKLQLLLDSIIRAKEACKGAMGTLMTLKHELMTLHNAEQVITETIATVAASTKQH